MTKEYEIYHGDCLEVIQSFPDESFDMIFADPPYLMSDNGKTCFNGKLVNLNKGAWDKPLTAEDNFEFHKKWLKECKRVLKKDGTIWVSGTYHNIHACGHAMMLLNYHILNEIAWFKPNAAPNISCKYFTASHESLIWAKKDKKSKHFFNYQAMKNGDFSKDFIKKPGLQMRTVWSIFTTPAKEKTFGYHTTQKPLALLDRIIEASTKPSDVVFDPFMGSGTTGVSCVKNKRKFVGIEREKTYFELAQKRIEGALNEQKTLFD